MESELWIKASRWTLIPIVALLIMSAPTVAADASVVLEAVQKLQENYVDQVDPVKLLNAAVQGLRKQLADANVRVDLSDLPSGISAQDARQQFIERFSAARSAAPALTETQLAYQAIRSAIEVLDDANVRFVPSEEYRAQQAEQRSGYGGIGFYLRSLAGRTYIFLVFPGGPAAAAGLRPLDRIEKVNGQSTEGIALSQVSTLVRGPTGTPVTLVLRRPGQTDPITVTVSRASIRLPTVVRTDVLSGEVGYLHLFNFGEGAASEFRSAVSTLAGRNIRSLILDLRGGGSGLVSELNGMLDALLAPGTVAYRTESPSGRSQVTASPPQALPANVRIIVLMDDTGALSGIMASALKDAKRGLLVGTKADGTSRIARWYELKDGSAMNITVQRVHTILGKRLDKNPVEPDVSVQMGVEDFDAGRDRLLEEALKRAR
jgi:carboxyl-terminal processing protease